MKKLKLIFLAIFVFILNLIWEFLHYKLYIDLTGIPSALHLIIASFTDLFLVFLIFFTISFFRRSIDWIENPKKLDYLVIFILGILIAMGIEYYSLSSQRWAYTELMPTIFGIGLSPLVQLFTTAIISLILIKIIIKLHKE